MDYWQIFIVAGGALIAFIGTVIKPIIKLNTMLTEASSQLSWLKTELADLKASTKQHLKETSNLSNDLKKRLDKFEEDLINLKVDYSTNIVGIKKDIEAVDNCKL